MRKRQRERRAHVHEFCLQAALVRCQSNSRRRIHTGRSPEWDAERALAALNIDQIAFTSTDGNCQGHAKQRQIAINPVAQLPHETLFHEAAHVILGHTTEADFADTERTPKNPREAEAVALLCCEALNLEGTEYCRGYIQNWLRPAVGHQRRRDS